LQLWGGFIQGSVGFGSHSDFGQFFLYYYSLFGGFGCRHGLIQTEFKPMDTVFVGCFWDWV
jgi:hypothetical protein